jgi:hypothetical protein
LGNFLSADKMSGATSEASMKSLRDTLCNLFQLEFEARDGPNQQGPTAFLQ